MWIRTYRGSLVNLDLVEMIHKVSATDSEGKNHWAVKASFRKGFTMLAEFDEANEADALIAEIQCDLKCVLSVERFAAKLDLAKSKA